MEEIVFEALFIEALLIEALFIEANTHMVLEGEGIVIWGRVAFHGKAYILRSPSAAPSSLDSHDARLGQAS